NPSWVGSRRRPDRRPPGRRCQRQRARFRTAGRYRATRWHDLPRRHPHPHQPRGRTMTVMERAKLAGAAAMVTGLWAAERIRPSRGARPGTVPGSPGDLTCDWLTGALCGDVPGARVVGFTVGAGSDGTSARRPLRVDYNEVGCDAHLPSALYTKSAPSLLSRLFCGLNRIGQIEGAFYL